MASKVTKGILISFWVLFAVAVGAVFFLFHSIANGSIGYMPPVEQLEIRLINMLRRSFRQTERHWEVMRIVRITVFLSIIRIFHRIW